MLIRNILFSVAALFMVPASIILPASVAHAQSKAAAAPTPEIEDLTITPDNQFAPGTELTFTLEGTPKGRARVRVTGINKPITLSEIDSGVYEGYHTISTKDRVTPRSDVRATLTIRGRSASIKQTLGGGVAAAPIASNPPAQSKQNERLTIQRFSAVPVDKVEPGAELQFNLTGTPGAKATFSIEGIAKDIPMQEVRSGQYEGSYTVRRSDKFPASPTVSATLASSGQTSTVRLNQSLTPEPRTAAITNLTPREGATVNENPVLISGTFPERGGAGVDPKSVRILVSGIDVTNNAVITPHFFNVRSELRPGTHTVEVKAADQSGNVSRQSWKFNVSSQAAPAAPAVTSLPLQITSHANNAQVSGGVIEIQGRTAPEAQVNVQVQATAQVFGTVGVNQKVYSDTIRADRSGNFAFSFQPQIPIPGARYDISLNASKGKLNKELKWVLVQQ